MEKILTVSIAAYNAEKWLKRCLDSFLIPEVLDELEIIIVNDGSKDGTAEVAEIYTNQYPKSFRLITQENGGLGATYNTSIQAATGRYFKTVDADDWVECEGLTELVRTLHKIEADMVISPYFQVDAVSNEKQKMEPYTDGAIPVGQVIPVEQTGGRYKLCMHDVTFRAETLKRHYIPADRHCFYVDAEYVVFYARHAQTVAFTRLPVYDYLINSAGQSVEFSGMVRRRDEHLRVTRRLIDFFENENREDSFPTVPRETMERVLCMMYLVLLGIQDRRESLDAVRAYDKELKERSPVLYRSAIRTGIKEHSETALVVALMRSTHFVGHRLIHKLTCWKK